MIPKSVKPRTLEDVVPLTETVALALVAVIIVAGLFLGREILVPVAFAVLLSSALADLVSLLQRLQVPRAVAVAVGVPFAFAIIFALGSLIATQLNLLAGDLPRYQTTIQSKIQSVRGVTRGSSRGKELDKPKASISDAPNSVLVASGGPKTLKPVPVEVLQPNPSALENLRSLISPLVSPLATTGIIIIFVIFILLQREDLRNRLIRLAGSHDLQVRRRHSTTPAKRRNRYVRRDFQRCYAALHQGGHADRGSAVSEHEHPSLQLIS